MNFVPGTRGYEASVRSFADASRMLEFDEVCKDFLAFLPLASARVVDIGAGVGQNSAALAEMGHFVVAVEPLGQLLSIARASCSHPQITWLQDSLPLLRRLPPENQPFEFILVEAVWHHLDEVERVRALKSLASLLEPAGRCALSLRNGPPGIGTHVFPTETENTLEQAKRQGMECTFLAENLPSILPHKEDVTWTRIVLQKH